MVTYEIYFSILLVYAIVMVRMVAHMTRQFKLLNMYYSLPPCNRSRSFNDLIVTDWLWIPMLWLWDYESMTTDHRLYRMMRIYWRAKENGDFCGKKVCDVSWGDEIEVFNNAKGDCSGFEKLPAREVLPRGVRRVQGNKFGFHSLEVDESQRNLILL